MNQTITMPDNWNLVFRDELLLGEGLYSTTFEDTESFFEINLNYIPSLEKFYIENVQLKGDKEILKNKNYSTFARTEADAMLRAKEMACFINQFILKPTVVTLFKQIPLHIISIDDDFHFLGKNQMDKAANNPNYCENLYSAV
ncbi:MAG TPA: hypothetical protein PK079_22785 [Leptospiraceae bacterium]|nr:hypothetical protein [Leptospiraceae bacterium]HMW08435.1 hypothetical protein [Leptospiraceae bacterium]HMY34262.1 hypothetical protein [Leptospiraceae bacterium]HMZ67241.1 hypothetical protein [Leptospiraceae bacterium]HNA10009.1 hypothetical protein [Leptospiraceae bacterium]